MNAVTKNAFQAVPPTPIIPETAPFTPEQRAWLNGFLAGLYGGGTGGDQANTNPMPAPTVAEEFPWHEPTLELFERLSLAQGRPLARRLMAAMAQLDCGQCGYLCQSYGEALAEGRETSMGLCVPGGKATQKALKALLAEAPVATVQKPLAPEKAAQPAIMAARFVAAHCLTKAGSSKDVRHVIIDLADTGLSYQPGDSLGVATENDPDLVEACLKALGAVNDAVTREILMKERDIARPLDRTLDLLAGAARDAGEAKVLRKLVDGDDGAEPGDADLLDLLQAFPSARPPLPDLLASLPKLKPRLYSIASSPLAVPGKVELCVGVVRANRRGRVRDGVASCHLAFRAESAGALPIYVQTSHFRLPENPATPIIMVGPGTGIAPFRAFLQHRAAQRLQGRAWLFFGDQHSATDFLFQSEIEAWQADGTLSNLSVAWSRDTAKKIYVQDKMREAGADLWRWLQDGAHFYVCGDASRMAKDVDSALREIAMKQGGLSADQARDWIVALARQHRYQRDVY